MKKRLTAILLMLAFFTTGALAASTYQKSILVEYGATFSFNGQPQSLYDANGSPVQPFIHNGTTYVPIRAVTERYGSYIAYDSGTNNIEVYDDFSELCAVVYAMSHVVNSCACVTLAETGFVASDAMEDCSELYNECTDFMRKVSDSLAYLGSDDGYNVNISIITDEILPSYQNFVSSFTVAHSAYNAYCNAPSSYTLDTFFDAVTAVSSTSDAALTAIEDFYDKYCLWRDLGFDE